MTHGSAFSAMLGIFFPRSKLSMLGTILITCVYYFTQVADFRSDLVTSQSSQSDQFKNNVQALKNLALIMGIFISCWVPFIVLNVIEAVHTSCALNNGLIIKLHKITSAMLLANSVVNPFVYAIRFRSFNVAFRLMCGCMKESQRHTAIEAVTSLWCVNLIVWGREEMTAILQTTFSKSFSLMEKVAFLLELHWNLSLNNKLTISQHYFR